jgi:hypothetical protein
VLLCNIPTLRQLISIARLEADMNNLSGDDISSVMGKIKETLSPILPEIKDDKDFDLSIGQFRSLMEYIQGISSENKTVSNEFSPKKKVASPKQ